MGTTTSPSGSGNLVVPQVYTGTSATAANVYVDSTGKFFRSTATGGGLGSGQTWQLVTRTSGTQYTNSTGNPIAVQMNLTGGGGISGSITVGATTPVSLSNGGGGQNQYGFTIVPTGSTYTLSYSAPTATVYELR